MDAKEQEYEVLKRNIETLIEVTNNLTEEYENNDLYNFLEHLHNLHDLVTSLSEDESKRVAFHRGIEYLSRLKSDLSKQSIDLIEKRSDDKIESFG